MTPMYSLTPNVDLEETLDVFINDTCAGSIWFSEGRWEACDENGKPLPGDTSLFAAVETVIERWRRLRGDVDDSTPEWADYYPNFADWVREQ